MEVFEMLDALDQARDGDARQRDEDVGEREWERQMLEDMERRQLEWEREREWERELDDL